MRLPPPDPFTTTCIYIAGIFMALREGAERVPTFVVLKALPGALSYVPLAILALAASVYLTRMFRSEKPEGLARIERKTFRNERVNIDQKYFLDCTFENVTLFYCGGSFEFRGTILSGELRIETNDKAALGGIELVKLIGGLTPSFVASWAHLPKEHFE